MEDSQSYDFFFSSITTPSLATLTSYFLLCRIFPSLGAAKTPVALVAKVVGNLTFSFLLLCLPL